HRHSVEGDAGTRSCTEEKMNVTRLKRENNFASFAPSLRPLRLRIFFNRKGRKVHAKGAKNFSHATTAILLTLALVNSVAATTLPAVQPSKVSVDAARLALIDAAVMDAIVRKELPGAVVLVAHRGGYAPDFDLSEQWSGYDEMLKRLYNEPLRSTPGLRFVYSDINFIALGEVVRRASGMPLDEFARREIYEPLGMRDTGFRPRAELLPRVAPTENVRGMKSYLGGTGEKGSEGERVLRGEVH